MKPAGPFTTIYLRLFVPFAVTLLLGTIIAWWIGTALLARTFEDRVLEQLHHAAEVVAERNFPINESVLLRLNKLLQASVYLMDAQGNLNPPAGPEHPPELLAALREHYQQWQTAGADVTNIRLSAAGRDYLVVLSQFDDSPKSQFLAVAAFAELSDVQAATRRGGMLLAVLAACGISLLALLGHRIARSITLPVSELAALAGNIAGGDRDARVDVRREDEIGELAHSLNRMAARLADYEQQVAAQSRLVTLGELSGKIAHEIRNPLTAIKMQLQMFEDEQPDAARPRLKTLMDEVRRLELIVDTTLQLGRQQQLERQQVELNALVSDVLALLLPQLEHRHITVTTELASDMRTCHVDPNRVKQILLNLVNNAMDELQQGGRILIRTRLLPDGATALEIADSGAGIPPERRHTLFEQANSGKPTGYGLGLRVTRELVELHGGTIEVTDSDLGGAQFRVLFPAEK